MSFRNRCVIVGAEGIISLSVPLKDGRNQQLPVKEVLISNTDNWQARHFKSIRSSYNRSPFFEFYADELAVLFQSPATHLVDWNLGCLEWIMKKLAWPGQIKCSKQAVSYRAPGMTDLRDQVLPKNYFQWSPVKYRQVFEERTGFFPNLSILDLLFNLGPQAGEKLSSVGSVGS